MAGMLTTNQMSPAMVEDLYGQYNRMFTPIDQLQSTGDPAFDEKRRKMYMQSAIMQGNADNLPYPQQAGGPLEITVTPDNAMMDAPAPSMIPQSANPILQPNSLLEAGVMDIAAPQGQTPLQDYVGANWQDLLSQGIAGLEDQYYRENLPADTYLKMRSIENDKELAQQNQLLNNLKLQSDLDYQKQSLDLKREELAIDRQRVLSGGTGSSYMEDARLLMQSDPTLDLGSAYAQARSGLPRGVFVSPQTGQVEAMGGFSETMAGLKGKEETAKELANKQASAFVEGQIALPKIASKVTAFEGKNKSLQEKADSLKARANGFTTGFGGSLLDSIKGSPAYDLAQDTKTLLANSGFDALQEMRDNSPTGGALGSIAVAELEMLQAAQQNLLTSQSKEQFLRNLDDLMALRAQSAQRIKAGLERDKAMFGGTYENYQGILKGGVAPFLEAQKPQLDDLDAQIRALEKELGLTQ